MKFSLIVPTINRVHETKRLFQSLVAQDYDNLEVIIVDQNPDDRLVKLVDSYRQHFPILHVRESKRGQSRARNIGFSQVKGDIVAFPDDDCLYPDGLLTLTAQFFDNNPQLDGVIGRVYDLEEDQNAFAPCGDDRSQEVDYAKGYKICVSCAMFFRAPVVEKIRFDERLGPGADTPWGCGDETDYLFQCLNAGYQFYYDANLIVRHPNPLKKNNFRQQIQREYGYGLGKGYFLATHTLPQSLLKFEQSVSYADALSEISKGHLRRASYFLVNGIGTSLGYRAGSKNIRQLKNCN
ncbi:MULTISPECIES: glycosyltransferase family 2 protein [unclassified Microcoleus]|uniref:glycosyltransferase family 2 protein n=1 Tax=unclassified Microcoleus TaxID=2642155 RepID=UPI002FD08FB0